MAVRWTAVGYAYASEIPPDGAWEMSALPDGQVQVILSWRLPSVDLAKLKK
ncbi:hypothetical protein G1O98_27665 [Nostoc sp. UIC10630]|nr:hypothetical protein [Nostoc sp. UIC 10630]